MHELKRERCTYALISTMFGVSYLGRFYLDAELFCQGIYTFKMEIVCVLVWLFEGVSIGVLMLFHRINYLHGSGLLKEEEDNEEGSQR